MTNFKLSQKTPDTKDFQSAYKLAFSAPLINKLLKKETFSDEEKRKITLAYLFWKPIPKNFSDNPLFYQNIKNLQVEQEVAGTKNLCFTLFSKIENNQELPPLIPRFMIRNYAH